MASGSERKSPKSSPSLSGRGLGDVTATASGAAVPGGKSAGAFMRRGLAWTAARRRCLGADRGDLPILGIFFRSGCNVSEGPGDAHAPIG